MKKLFVLVLTLLVIVSAGFAQKNNTVSAYNTWKKGKLDKAKEYIDKAAVHEKTMTDPKTWTYRGHIYFDISQSLLPAYKELDPNALEEAYQSYLKAIEYDPKGDWADKAKAALPEIAKQFFNQGANSYNDARQTMDQEGGELTAQMIFKKSVENFEKAYEVYQQVDYVDTLALYYASVSAELAGQRQKAKGNLEKLVEYNYPEPDIYIALANIYYEEDQDVDMAISTFQIGKEKFPGNTNLLLSEINVYLKEGQVDKAIEGLTKAVELDPENPTVHFAIGAKYNEISDDTLRSEEVRKDALEKSINAYQQALELKPDYFEPAYNLGAIYVNKASGVIDIANQLPLEAQDEYDKMMKEANEYLSLALPHLETALEIIPNDQATLVSLKEIYTRLNMLDKLKEVNAKLEQ